ncbi:MAG: 6-carboxytetrahydropterin synthase [Bacteroidales bacterium]|nr:6-carboxytetrahydropterin synthase [Bacteroidales bacterium]MBN2817792.1 6-carboxytetrahydropterin synthase [Bacteroidales bacterium]
MNTKISISKEFTWSMAHMLADHKGKCKNIHGHTYKMLVELERNDTGVINNKGNTEHGMVKEFDDVKKIVNDLVVDKLDHAFLYWIDSTDELEHDVASLLKKHNRKLVNINYRPTAENLASDFFEKINKELKPLDITLKELILWESPTSFARVRA